MISQVHGFCLVEGNSVEKAVASTQSCWVIDDGPASWKGAGHGTNSAHRADMCFPVCSSMLGCRSCPLGPFRGQRNK